MAHYFCVRKVVVFYMSILTLALVTIFSISGTIRDASDSSILPDAAIVMEDREHKIKWATSDESGKYCITGLHEGTYTIKTTYIGYHTTIKVIKISKDCTLDILLKPDQRSLNEVVVTAIENHGTTSSTRIGNEAIEHIQPSSFADLLELLPGGSAKDPVLSSPQLINLRAAGSLTDSDYATSALGTKFVIDGHPINNDANLQSTPAYSSYGSSYVNFGTDMREISTEDIENVEIVRGIASVKYGDLTSGLINIIRKKGGNDIHARFKSDMKSKLFYIGKGFEWKDNNVKSTINTSLNYLDSKADPRYTRQNWKRLTVSLRGSRTIEQDDLLHSLNANLDYTGSFDNEKSDANLDLSENGTPIETYKSSYNKFSLGGNYSIKNTDEEKLFRSWDNSISLYYEMDEIDRWRSVSLGLSTPVSTSLDVGEHDATIIPAKYDATLKVDGRPFYLFAQSNISLVKGIHHIQMGFEWNMDKNFGKGSIFDPTRPFSTSMSVRPRPYYVIPAMHQLSAYSEEKMKKEIGKCSLEAIMGLRLETISGAGEKYDINLKPYLDPRATVRLNLPDAMIGGGYRLKSGLYAGIGYHTKFPTMDMLFPEPLYGSLTQLNYWPTEENLRRVNMLVYRIDPTNTELKAARNLKWEVGADLLCDGYSFSINYFQEDMTSGFRYASQYISVESKRYDTSSIDKSTLSGPPQLSDLPYSLDTTLTSYSFTTNGSRTLKKGVEFSFYSKRIKSLNTKFSANGAWFRTEYMNSVPEYYKPSVIMDGKPYPYVGIYELNDGKYYDSLVSNLMIDTQIPELGLIFSTSLQCLWFSGYKTMPTSKYPISYIDKSGKIHDFDKEKDVEDGALRLLVREYTESLYQYQRTPFAMNVNLKLTKKLYRNKISCSLYVNRIFDITPDYYRNGTLVRRSVTPYFGMELDFKI